MRGTDGCAGVDEEASQGHPGPREPEHGRRPTRERPAGHGRGCEVHVGVHRPAHVDPIHAIALMLARKKVTPSSPPSAPMIQKRPVTLVSGQPSISK